MSRMVIIMGVFGVIALGVLGWVLSLVIRALLKYVKAGDVRKEKAVVRQSLGEVLKERRTECK